MSTRKLIKVFLAVVAACAVLSGGANAQQGAPFFQMYVGNYWEYEGTETPGGGTWTWRDAVVALDDTTVPNQITFKVEGSEDGTVMEKFWYSLNQTEMKLWRIEFLEQGDWLIIALNEGIRVAKNPMVVGDSWTDNTTGTFNGNPITMTSEVSVESYDDVTVPLGTYKAYKLNRTISIEGMGDVEESSYWVVPYIGIIKREFPTDEGEEIEELYEMGIRKAIVDFGSDGKTDISVYRRNAGAWFVLPSSGATPYGVGWGGEASDIPVPGDYDGDGKTDIAVYRSSSGAWYVIPSGGASPYGLGWGGETRDIPVPGDYDGDGKTDIAVYRADTGAWYVIPSGGASPYGLGWGGDSTDVPVPGDYDGDGKTDIAVYRSSSGAWYVIPSGGADPYGVGWGGEASDIPVPGDYDGDGKIDVAVYRTSQGAWYIYPSGGADPYGVGWGGDYTDVPLTTNPASYILAYGVI